jgi:hypothetical protein
MSAPPTQCGIPVKGGSPLPPQASPTLPPSSSLDPSETAQPRPPGEFIRHQKCGSIEHSVEPVSELESRFRHSGWAVRRYQVWQALMRTHAGDSRLARFANCGSGLWLQKSADGQDIRLTSNCCHDRWCIPCQTARSAALVEALAREIDTSKCRLLTLTLRAGNTSLIAQLDRLYRSFATFRRRADWKDHVRGGCGFCEVKIGSGSGLWHVHLHAIIEGSWWHQRDISRAWHEITGDSSIVDIRPIGDAGQVSHYVCKYVTKPADASVYAVPARLDELIIALKGRRLALPFGSWSKINLTDRPADDVVWTTVARVESLRADADAGDPVALRWLEAASRKWPLLAPLFEARPADSS